MENTSHISTCDNKDCERSKECYRYLITQELMPINFKNICNSPSYEWFFNVPDHLKHMIKNEENITMEVEKNEDVKIDKENDENI